MKKGFTFYIIKLFTHVQFVHTTVHRFTALYSFLNVYSQLVQS